MQKYTKIKSTDNIQTNTTNTKIHKCKKYTNAKYIQGYKNSKILKCKTYKTHIYNSN